MKNKPGVNLKAMLLGISTTDKQKNIKLAISQIALGWNNQNTIIFGGIGNDTTKDDGNQQEDADGEQ